MTFITKGNKLFDAACAALFQYPGWVHPGLTMVDTYTSEHVISGLFQFSFGAGQAIFGPKPWVNPFGKMSIFRLFELLVFIA